MSDTYLSNIIRNVNVPAGVPITPNQPFVNAMAKQALNVANKGFDFSSSGITDINDTYLTNLTSLNQSSTGTANLSGNHIADPARINSILGDINSGGMMNGVIDISGGTMASPPPATPHLDEIFTLTVPGSPVNGLAFTITYALGATTIIFDNTINLSASSNDGSGNITVGILDTQTAAVRAAKIVALWNEPSGSTAVDNGSGTFTVTDTTESNYPYSFSDAGSGITYVENQAGQTLVQNANLLAAIANGNVVHYNQPSPRNTALPVLSGSTPPYAYLPLTCSNGTWIYATTYTYQWQTSADGLAGWTNIFGATSSTYTPTAVDLGNYLRCRVTAINTAGSASASSFHSEVIQVNPAIRTGLVAEYLFASGSELLDTSGNGNTLTNINGVTFSSNTAHTVGTNADFSSSYLYSNATLNGLSAGTYACIVNNIGTPIQVNAMILTDGSQAGTWSNGNPSINYYNGGGTGLQFEGKLMASNSAGLVDVTNTLHYLAFRINGDGTFDFWIDGVNTGTGTGAGLIVGTNLLIALLDGQYFDGASTADYQKVRVWNRALTDAEIAILAVGY